MPRRVDIIPAFYQAINIEQNGRHTVTSAELVRQLILVNYDRKLAQAQPAAREVLRVYFHEQKHGPKCTELAFCNFTGE